MINKKIGIKLFITSLAMGVSLTACGYDDSVVSATTAAYQQGVYTQQIQTVGPSYNPCTCQLQAAQQSTTGTTTTATPSTTTSTATTSTTTPTTSTITPAKTETVSSTPAKTTTSTATTTKTTTTATDPASKGRLILDKMLANISTPNAFQAVVDKYEKSLTDGKVVQQSFNVYARKPGQMKLEVTYHTNASTIGAKISFTEGTGKAMVRPGGALSFITKEFAQNDDNLISPNGYTPEQVDFFNMVKRLSSKNYKAELTGKTNLNGSDVYLLKVTSTATNEFDSRIKYEIMGFDPKTFDVKLWETYADSSTDAFMRITIKSFTPLSSLPDDTFKV